MEMIQRSSPEASQRGVQEGQVTFCTFSVLQPGRRPQLATVGFVWFWKWWANQGWGSDSGAAAPNFSGHAIHQNIVPFLEIADINISVQSANQYLRV